MQYTVASLTDSTEHPTDRGMRKNVISVSQEIKNKLSKDAWRFDIYGLIEVLLHLGYTLPDINLVGHQGLESQPGLVRKLYFDTDSRVTIVLYFGISGANGVIPTYLMKMADSGIINDRHFHELLTFIDRYLLRTWLNGMLPELNQDKLGQIRWVRSIQNFNSLSSIIWVFTNIYPDLQVRAYRKVISIGNATRPAKLGHSKIGIEMILGNEFKVINYGFDITLIAQDEEYKLNHPWHTEIQKRFKDHIIPLLKGLDIYIDLCLIIRSTKSWFKIENDGSHLGYERLKGGENQSKRIHIHTGYII